MDIKGCSASKFNSMRLSSETEINTMDAIDAIDAQAMHAVAEDLFRRSRFGDVIGGTKRLRRGMTQLMDTGRSAEARRMGVVLLADHGGYAPPLSCNPVAQARQLMRQYGLTAADITDQESDPRYVYQGRCGGRRHRSYREPDPFYSNGISVVGPVGLEPTTYGLKVLPRPCRSTIRSAF